jgi:uncharacterized protein (DUF2132 family)
MTDQQANNPLHGITLEMILTHLVEHYGWEEMGRLIRIRCFTYDPSIKSSLAFLRKTPWARKKVENLYLRQKRVRIKRQKISKKAD